jgi:chromosome segregation ATPase
LIENPFKPYEKGAVFTAIPSGKPYTYGTESLSSGEASLANLALFIAINTAIGSKFILIDEIDAHLDNDNLG